MALIVVQKMYIQISLIWSSICWTVFFNMTVVIQQLRDTGLS